ncbi:helix-turn-helix domain-containing protein [Methylobacillus sp. Pita2]|uniref:helix-turn-helix domain-containing protein n=1 Tax=Methylobacillus sp. Pita2 TaxID=3383245 RepID=UPI0038B6A420
MKTAISKKQKAPSSLIFGAVLRDARKAAGLTQDVLAARCELDRTYIGDLERGMYSPTLVVIIKLSNGLGTDLDALLCSFSTAYRISLVGHQE